MPRSEHATRTDELWAHRENKHRDDYRRENGPPESDEDYYYEALTVEDKLKEDREAAYYSQL